MKFCKRKKYPKQEKISDKKELNPKIARLIFLIAVGLLVLMVPFSFLMAKNANVVSKQTNVAYQELQTRLKDDSKEITGNDSLARRYFDAFVDVYMNKPTNENDSNRRIKELSSYFVKKLPKEEETNAFQKLDASSFFTIKRDGETRIAQYVVTYEVQFVTDKKERKREKQTVLLNIPFIQKEEQFKVSSLPYYSSIPSLNAGDMEAKVVPTNQFKQVDEKQQKKLADFLKQFYELYCSKDKKQLSYLMNEPEVLGEGFSIRQSEPVFYQLDDKVLAIDTPTISEGKSENNHKEYLVFTIVSKDGKYFIDTLKHDLGGI